MASRLKVKPLYIEYFLQPHMQDELPQASAYFQQNGRIAKQSSENEAIFLFTKMLRCKIFLAVQH